MSIFSQTVPAVILKSHRSVFSRTRNSAKEVANFLGIFVVGTEIISETIQGSEAISKIVS